VLKMPPNSDETQTKYDYIPRASCSTRRLRTRVSVRCAHLAEPIGDAISMAEPRGAIVVVVVVVVCRSSRYGQVAATGKRLRPFRVSGAMR